MCMNNMMPSIAFEHPGLEMVPEECDVLTKAWPWTRCRITQVERTTSKHITIACRRSRIPSCPQRSCFQTLGGCCRPSAGERESCSPTIGHHQTSSGRLQCCRRCRARNSAAAPLAGQRRCTTERSGRADVALQPAPHQGRAGKCAMRLPLCQSVCHWCVLRLT